MEILFSVDMFVLGLALVLCFAEKLMKTPVGTAAGFGVFAFVVSIGFDPENLAVGVVSSFGRYDVVDRVATTGMHGARRSKNASPHSVRGYP